MSRKFQPTFGVNKAKFLLVMGVGLWWMGNRVSIPILPKVLDSASLANLRQEMKETLSRDGAKEGYEKIKDFYIKPYLGSGISSHILVHIDGEELYHHSGFDAVRVCDDQFDYG